MTCKLNPHIERYIEMVESGELVACNGQRLLCSYIRKCFETENIYTDDEQFERYLGLSKYFPFDDVFEWERFCLALHLCTYKKSDGRPRWSDLFLLIGRGAGKDGFIALESLALISPYNLVRKYDVDICANAEEQAMRPVNDLLSVLEDTRYYNKLKRHFCWTKEKITGIKYGGTIKGRTNNPKSKDGMRSGIIIFNEIHQYENYGNVKVFMTGLGKKKHPRILYATTNGDIRDGPLDELIARSESILKGEVSDNGLLPFICRLDNKGEANNPGMWVKANPSLTYMPDLLHEIEKEFELWKNNPIANSDFMTKRMNLPQSDADIAVTDWDNILATKRDLPQLDGWSCTCGIDYASVSDFASVNLHFKKGNERYDINHSWLCLRSKELFRIKAPWREWSNEGLLTVVDDVEINPELLCEYILKQSERYNIVKMALDNFRYALIASSLKKIGFDAKDFKNVKLVRPSDIMTVVPVVESCFANHCFTWGDNPPLRWATNNTKLVRASRKIGSDTGSFYYAKIEGKSRKTDPFMALVASMTIESELETGESSYDDLPVIVI